MTMTQQSKPSTIRPVFKLVEKEKVMNDLKFNINAFAKPTTRAEYSALLVEAVRMAEELDEKIEAIGAALEAQATARSAVTA